MNGASWLLKMAWRDSRRNRSRLFLFMASIVLGIAALTAIYSLGFNLNNQIDEQAASLLGADMEWVGNKPFEASERALADSVAAATSEEMSFGSMVYFPATGGSRLVQIRALKGDFPYYGTLETLPAAASADFRTGKKALVDQNLLLQYRAGVGDSIKVGEVTFEIAGSLIDAPGQTGIVAAVAPVVYIPLSYLEATGLEQKGSRINYRLLLRMPDPSGVDTFIKNHKERLETAEVTIRTVEDQKDSTGRLFRNLTVFLGLAGFVALLLGCVGVASAVHIYVKEKVNTIAILRCLGVRAKEAFLIFLIQIICIGFTGSLIGALAGSFLQRFLPVLLADFLPFALDPVISVPAIAQGILLGVIISVLFSLISFISIRNISPLHVFRISFEDSPVDKDPLRWLIYSLICVFILVFAFWQLQDWSTAFAFSAGIMGAFLLLVGVARGITWLIRRFFPVHWGYLARQGLANLFRPNNQTVILVVAIGLGTMLICTLLLSRDMLLNQIQVSTSEDRPNMVLFDVQEEQLQALSQLITDRNLPLLQSVPIVNTRLEKMNSLDAAAVRKDSTRRRLQGMFRREYRVTYRDTLSTTEKITKGSWVGQFTNGLVPVSVEAGFADRNRIDLGDTLQFNVQGSLVMASVASLREVDWRGMQTNFVIVFPKGILEEAPQFHVLLTRMPTLDQSADFQQEVVTHYPNVSIVDLSLVFNIVDKITDKVGFVIRFLAGFSMLTGLIVLITSVLISKYQRIRESILLRTLGAVRKQILFITGWEYFFLGAIASLTGIGLAVTASWGLARFSFETDFQPDLLPVTFVFAAITAITVVIGLINSSGILSQSPLEILRQES